MLIFIILTSDTQSESHPGIGVIIILLRSQVEKVTNTPVKKIIPGLIVLYNLLNYETPSFIVHIYKKKVKKI